MRRIMLWAMLLAPLAAAAAPVVYRWVDAHGVVHYSDQPHAGAVKVDLGSPSIVSFKTPPAESPVPGPATAVAGAVAYRVRILAPANGTTLRPADWRVRAAVTVTPRLGKGAALQYRLDGKAAGPPTRRTSMMLDKVYRGAHTLTVDVLGPGGKQEAQASSTFYIHHPSLLFKHRSPSRH